MRRKLVLTCLVASVMTTSSHAQPGNAWLSLLRNGDFAQLEAQTVAFQKRFETGQETEFALRLAYRPFYDINEQDWKSLDEWQKACPKSYAVRLIRGAYYKRAGFRARGGSFANETTSKQFTEMNRLFGLALVQLNESLALTEKPFLSVWHLIDLQNGDRVAQKALVDTGTKMFPANTLIRARYMRALRPRWAGSYEEMNEFLSYARSTGATPAGLAELEAIIDEDIGDVAMREGNRTRAIRYFQKALQLGEKAGGDVTQELESSWYYRCQLPELAAYCR